jgi:hypothetical protein
MKSVAPFDLFQKQELLNLKSGSREFLLLPQLKSQLHFLRDSKHHF